MHPYPEVEDIPGPAPEEHDEGRHHQRRPGQVGQGEQARSPTDGPALHPAGKRTPLKIIMQIYLKLQV